MLFGKQAHGGEGREPWKCPHVAGRTLYGMYAVRLAPSTPGAPASRFSLGKETQGV